MSQHPRSLVRRLAWGAGVLLVLIPLGHVEHGSARQDLLGTPITPAPAECLVPPRSVQDLIQLGALPGSPTAISVDIASTEPATAPVGSPADQGTTSAVIAVVREYIACLNAFDTSRSFALFTDRYLAATLYDFGPLPGLTLSPGQVSIVLPEDAWRSFAVASVTILTDGRAAAVVNVLSPGASGGLVPGQIAQATYVFAQDGERWRIDETLVDDASRGNEIVAGATFAGVIFNVLAAADLVAYFGDTANYEQFWHPTRRDIFALESSLLSYLGTEAPALAMRVGAEEYLRQYAGVIADGQPLILINAFCDADGTTWIDTPYAVDDGGNCYFSVRYDVTAGTFFDLRINGDA